MGSVNMDCDTKRELDDSGCVQDDAVSTGQVGLLDLSDDVLLYILRHCSPRDLKALGFACGRLGRLVQERALWRAVDARGEPCSQSRLLWYVDNVLHADTQVLMISGYARAADGCLGLINATRHEAEEERKLSHDLPASAPSNVTVSDLPEGIHQIPIPVQLERQQARFFVTAQRSGHVPRFRGFPSWPEPAARRGPQPCSGPQFSLSAPLLQQLSSSCPRLATLVLDYCCIDCNTTCLSNFPRTLKKLSLRGSKCYNMTIDKSFLFKIQDYLPVLECLDVSECEWMDPATLLPLSKLPSLQELYMRDCHKLAEFVAYASLTARYGFRTLRVLDLRGSPVGDSEVSALGWLPLLERLWLSAARARKRSTHAHYTDDVRAQHGQLAPWEKTVPDYFKTRTSSEAGDDVMTVDDQRHVRDVTFGDVFHEGGERSRSRDDGSEESKKRKTEDGDEGDGSSPKKRRKVSDVNGGDRTGNEDGGDGDERGPGERQRNGPDCIVDCIKIDQLIDVGEMRRGRQNEVIVIANSAKVRSPAPSGNRDDYVRFRRNQRPVFVDAEDREPGRDVNEGASTSRDEVVDANDQRQNDGTDGTEGADGNEECPEHEAHCGGSTYTGRDVFRVTSEDEDEDCEDCEADSSDSQERFVHFRKNRMPVFVSRVPSAALVAARAAARRAAEAGEEAAPRESPRAERAPPVQYQVEPRHHVLYVSVGPQVNTYRFPRDDGFERRIDLDFLPSHVESSSLVTDFAIRRFGRADGEDVNIIHIGPDGPVVVGQAAGSRPDRSNLRFLSVTGYRNVTDRSLLHLASAAPELAVVDFSDTNVTRAGAETFRGLRPDCRLTHSAFVDKND